VLFFPDLFLENSQANILLALLLQLRESFIFHRYCHAMGVAVQITNSVLLAFSIWTIPFNVLVIYILIRFRREPDLRSTFFRIAAVTG
jgi:hypothetical protein